MKNALGSRKGMYIWINWLNFTYELQWLAVAYRVIPLLWIFPPVPAYMVGYYSVLAQDYSSSGLSLSNWFHQQTWRKKKNKQAHISKLSKGQEGTWKRGLFRSSYTSPNCSSLSQLSCAPANATEKLGEQRGHGRGWGTVRVSCQVGSTAWSQSSLP